MWLAVDEYDMAPQHRKEGAMEAEAAVYQMLQSRTFAMLLHSDLVLWNGDRLRMHPQMVRFVMQIVTARTRRE